MREVLFVPPGSQLDKCLFKFIKKPLFVLSIAIVKRQAWSMRQL